MIDAYQQIEFVFSPETQSLPWASLAINKKLLFLFRLSYHF